MSQAFNVAIGKEIWWQGQKSYVLEYYSFAISSFFFEVSFNHRYRNLALRRELKSKVLHIARNMHKFVATVRNTPHGKRRMLSQLSIFFSSLPCQGEKRSWKGQTCNLCYPYQGHETKPVNKKNKKSSTFRTEYCSNTVFRPLEPQK